MLTVLIVIKQCFLRSVMRTVKKYIDIWERISNLVGKKFHSEPVYVDNDKYIKAKIKIYGGNVNTIFQGKKCQKKILFEPSSSDKSESDSDSESDNDESKKPDNKPDNDSDNKSSN